MLSAGLRHHASRKSAQLTNCQRLTRIVLTSYIPAYSSNGYYVEYVNPFGETFGFNARSKPREDATLEHVGPTYTLSLLHG